MTDSLKVQKLKTGIKKAIGDENYLIFMQHLSNGIDTVDSLAERWKLSTTTIHRWREKLGYKDGKTRQQLRWHNSCLTRINDRNQKNEKLIKFLLTLRK